MDKTKAALLRAIKIIGGPTAVGRLFDPPITSQAVSQWEITPIIRVLAIEAATDYRVTRHDLRPDIYPLERDGMESKRIFVVG